MAFDIQEHLKSHAEVFKAVKNIDLDEVMHFTFSFSDLQFKNEKEAKNKLLKLLEALLVSEHTLRQKNGFRRLSDGSMKQKYTTRRIKVQAKALAIHLKGWDGKHTHPHIHLLLPKKQRLGKNFSILKEIITKESAKLGLLPHFSELKQNYSGKSRIGWIIGKTKSHKLKRMLDDGTMEKMLDTLAKRAVEANQLLWYVKTLKKLQYRLKRMKKDFYWKGVNLRYALPIPITKEIEVLKKVPNLNEKEILANIDNPYLLDYARWCKGIDAFLIDELKKQGLKIKKSKEFLAKFEKVYSQELIRKAKVAQDPKMRRFVKDLMKAAKESRNEKELREKMQSLGYEDFGLKKRRGNVIGYRYKEDGKRVYISEKESFRIVHLRRILQKDSEEEQQVKFAISKKREEKEREKYAKKIEKRKGREKRMRLAKALFETDIQEEDTYMPNWKM